MNIQNAVEKYIAEGGQAEILILDGRPGVLFKDEGEGQFIPWDRLGYNAHLGFYDVAQHPAAHNEAGVNFSPARFTVPGGIRDDQDYTIWAVIPDDSTDGLIIGEWAAVIRLHQALTELIESGGQNAELVDELDPRLGHPWFNCREAARYAAEIGVEITDRAIAYACQRGEVRLANRDSGRWLMPRHSLIQWLADRPRPGPQPAT